MRIRILWDLDGTIVNTVPSLIDTFCIFAEKHYDIQADRKVVERLTKINSKELFSYYSIKQTDESIEQFRKINRSIPINELPLFNGVKDVLMKSELNVLVTNRECSSTVKILKFWNLTDLFAEVICADDQFPKKPDPSSYEYVHGRYNIDLVIGDRELDLMPARPLGIKTCLYNNRNVEADIHISDYGELLQHLHR